MANTSNKKPSGKGGKSFDAELKRLERQRNKEFAALLKPLQKFGIYNPKETKLTKYRAARVRKAYKEFADMLDPTKFLFAQAPKKKARTLKKKAKAFPDVYKPTNRGIFVAREGFKTAKVQVDKSGEASIIRAGKSETGERVRRRTKSITPLATLDDMDRQRDKIRKAAEKLGPLKPGEGYVYIIKDNGGENYGRNIYGSLDLLLAKLDGYDKGRAREAGKRGLAWLTLMRHLEIQKWSYDQFAETDTRNDRSARAHYRRRGRRLWKRGRGE